MNDGKQRILVVDDELGIREGCRKILTSEGYEVETAEDGLAGLDLFREDRDFSAALIDLKMPRMGGMDLIGKLRELDEDIVLLVITAYATLDTAVEATKRGAYAYVAKPFTPDELLLPVRNGLERRALSIQTRRLSEERQKGLLEIAFERSKCNTIIKCMADGVLVFNRDGQVVLRNAAAARAFLGNADLRLPAPIEQVVACPELQDLATEVLQAHATPLIASKEAVCGESTYMMNASPVVEPSGEILGGVVVLRDISTLKKLEVAKSTFVSMVAHELKSPLAAIESYLNVILSGVAGEDTQRDRQMMQRALLRAQALRSLVSDLLNLTAIEAGKFAITRSPLDIRQVVDEVVASCREKAQEKGIELSVAPDGQSDAIQALADRDAMLSVFTNLIDNAVKYTPEKGHVRVGIEHNDASVTVTVEDDGIGMTDREAARAFEEFYRANNEHTARVPGTGLGLSLVKRLVELHDGRISVRTAPGQGSEFTVCLPSD